MSKDKRMTKQIEVAVSLPSASCIQRVEGREVKPYYSKTEDALFTLF
jgi:hypothetical protein